MVPTVLELMTRPYNSETRECLVGRNCRSLEPNIDSPETLAILLEMKDLSTKQPEFLRLILDLELLTENNVRHAEILLLGWR